ncbi:hypothetical protein [Streptomyces sp. AC1-42T]|uniref:hypothetical protein n=1 Tax=Streptomyces sp. AC1-42T TaxID=2218665 RepID=UPI000DADCC02|nr:hypothetical protein [Streptomyces sp. AC1-42T]PZT71426.1 hypothetical protein DNK55_32450 [Streptomyces sp. AC1-42T]
MTVIALAALDPARGETYEIDSQEGDGFRHGVVAGQFGTISGDPVALNELAAALVNAARGAVFAHALRVDEPGELPLEPRGGELPHEAGDMTSAELAVAQEADYATQWVWASAAETSVPVEAGDWTAGPDGTAVALVDDFTELRFTLDGEVLTARSRCPHDQVHERTVEHPRDLANVQAAATQCSGHPGGEPRD